MKQKKLYHAIVLASTAVAGGLSTPAYAQEGRGLMLEEVVVTARRREERLQDVPISMTVFNQQQLDNANIVTAADLATYTPSLQVNTRFGEDSTNFAIRGFSQELRTTASVGVYFAEVVAPRGANTTQSGDGAGPGDLFDLANVQVLKGPQGTLFGRNTTGGAVLLTPVKPTDKFEGYLEASAGNFDMKRLQGVVNIPLADSVRLRLGVDHQKRDGYMENISDIGPDDFADMDYVSLRGSLVWDITDTLENYTIVKWTDSSNNGYPYEVLDCAASGAFAALCQGDLAQRRAAGANDPNEVYNFMPKSYSELEQKQVINTTTWQVSDNFTVKNIISYAEFESSQNYALYGTNWQLPVFSPAFQPSGTRHLLFQQVGSRDWPTADQKTLSEELQFQGVAFDGRFTWQAGLYYEESKPNGNYGSLNPSTLSCDQNTILSSDPADWRCNNLLVALGALQQGIPVIPAIRQGGSGLSAPGGVTYENQAAYFQGTYDLTQHWSLTAGVRYTRDETDGWTDETVYYFPGSVFGEYFAYDPAITKFEARRPSVSSEEPTWMVSLEYKPVEDVMIYGKYARGYRQGSVNVASVSGWDTHGPEQVDTYEIGAKMAFEGRFPATLSVAAFYNDFQDQQIQFGYLRDNGVGTTSILNAGESEITGLELDGTLQLTSNLLFSLSYAYLDTEVKKMHIPTEAEYPEGVQIFSGTTTAEGEPLPYTPRHSVVASATYLFPLDPALGDLSASLTYTYSDEMQAVSKATSPYAVLPSYELFNASVNWKGIAGSPLDAALFVTNLLDEEYLTSLTGNWTSGFEMGRHGQPRMWGARVRYDF
jgi:iron complex outermembrane receptor protein